MARPSSKTATSRARRSKTVERGPSPAPARKSTAEAAPAVAAVFEAPARMAAVWTEFADQAQRAGQRTLQGLQHDTQVEQETLQRATPQQWAGLPIGAMAEQATRWAELSTQLAGGLLDVQAAWFKELESVTTQLIGPWFTHDGRFAFTSAQDLVEPPDDAGPASLLWSAQRVWSESAKVWLHAMSHDVQPDAAPR